MKGLTNSRNNRSGMIRLVFIILAIGFLADAMVWYASPDSFAAREEYTLKADEALCSGCEIKDGVYIPRDSYGQLNFAAEVPEAETIVVRFSEPLSRDMDMRVYYAMDMAEIDRSRSVSSTFAKGKSEASFIIPKGEWKEYRFDFYGDLSIKDLLVAQKTTRVLYRPNLLRVLLFIAIQAGLIVLYTYTAAFRKGVQSVYHRFIDPETRIRAVDILYIIFALIMISSIIYTSLKYFIARIGMEHFRIPMIVFSIVSIILGQIWKNKGAWILAGLLLLAYLRVFLFKYDAMGVVEPFLISGLFVFFGCYPIAFAIRKEFRRMFLFLFASLWTTAITVLSVLGICVAITGRDLGGYMTLSWFLSRLSIIRHPVCSGIMESASIAVVILGFSMCRKKAGKVLFISAMISMLLAGILTATRTNYILTACVFSITICILLYDRMKPEKRKGGYYLPIWKWAALGAAFFVIVIGLSLIQPYIIDGFNVAFRRGDLPLSRAYVENIEKPVSKIANRNFSNNGAISLTGRIDIWKGLFRTIREEPSILWYGQSLDYNMNAINAYVHELLGHDVYHCHNLTLQMLLENGLPAALLHAACMFYFLFHGFRLMTDKDQALWKRMIPIPGIVCMTAGLVDITSHFRTGNPQMVILYLIIGFTVLMDQKGQKDEDTRISDT